MKYHISLITVSLSVLLTGAAWTAEREVIKARQDGKAVPENVMKEIHEKLKTPYKYGVVIKGEGGKLADCPNVFRHNGKWYMMYVSNPGQGYETYLAVSDDLLKWTPLGKNLTFTKSGWDAWQADTSIALYDPAWGGSYELQQYDGKYWLSYIGGALQGYEPDPLAIGMAWSNEPAAAKEWTRIAENPVLTRDQPDIRPFENTTLYKSTIIWDKQETLGYPFVMYYNGKRADGSERIGMAVSKNMTRWSRYGTEPVIDNGSGNSGDPQITRIGEVWVMIYYGAFWKPKAFDTFACSYDMVTWTKWTGPHLVEPSVPFDNEFAHKPWVVFHNGVVYHFYCASGDQGRVIAVATSKELKQ
ncbi:MAG: glycosylase [Verrucomicrobia bacterium]|nr:glycosylase [Verrucomicrobiota bacterium]